MVEDTDIVSVEPMDTNLARMLFEKKLGMKADEGTLSGSFTRLPGQESRNGQDASYFSRMLRSKTSKVVYLISLKFIQFLNFKKVYETVPISINAYVSLKQTLTGNLVS